MSTYRERREAKAERLREWADKRDTKAAAARATSDAITDQIPMGQPILVGHHSETRHRRALERSDNAMRKTLEHSRKADDFRSRADSIDTAADRAIYSDDVDAIEKLRERIADLEAKRERIKAANAAYRKEHKAELKELTPFGRDRALPFPGYVLTNLSGNLTRNRKRLAQMEASQ